MNPFAVAAFGKQRRTLDLGDGGVLTNSFCDPLVGLKGGLQFQVTPNVVIAPAIGLAFNLDENDRTSVFAEVELNRTFVGGGFVGTGLGLYDVFDGDNLAPTVLLHAGMPLTKYADERARLLFVIEGRLFLNELDNIDNNYQFWGGFRYVFR